MKTSDDIPAGPLSEHELRELWNQQADEHNQWESLDSDEQLAWAQVRAIARDREAVRLAESDAGDETGRILRLAKIIRDVDGNHDKGAAALAEAILSHPDIRLAGLDAEPVAADGEVAELVEWLNSTGELAGSADIEESKRYWRAAELLQQRHLAPVAASERLPDPGQKVLARYFNDLNKSRTICAIWLPAKTWEADADYHDDSFGEYDKEANVYFWPEGWYEDIENWDEYQYVTVNEGEVTHWQPLPQWPTTAAPALPLPAGEEA